MEWRPDEGISADGKRQTQVTALRPLSDGKQLQIAVLNAVGYCYESSLIY